MAKKHVFSYGAGKAEAKGSDLTKNVLGGKGIGLLAMREHAMHLGGVCDISSDADGVRIRVQLPLAAD